MENIEVQKELTAEQIKVMIIDTDKLNKEVTEQIGKERELREYQTFECWGKLALITGEHPALVNEEFIAFTKPPYPIEFWSHIKKPDGSGSFNMFPEFSITLDEADLIDYYAGETTLAEFTKRRRGYNSRIQSNECGFIKYLMGDK